MSFFRPVFFFERNTTTRGRGQYILKRVTALPVVPARDNFVFQQDGASPYWKREICSYRNDVGGGGGYAEESTTIWPFYDLGPCHCVRLPRGST